MHLFETLVPFVPTVLGAVIAGGIALVHTDRFPIPAWMVIALSAVLLVFDGLLTLMWFVIGEAELWDTLGDLGLFALVVVGQLGAVILWLAMLAAVFVKRSPVERA